MVEKKWMGENEFLSAMTMCRILPGANQVNMAVFAGTKMRGLPGAVTAVFGLCFVPVILMLVAGFFYFRFKEVPAVKGILHGASTAAVALTLAMVKNVSTVPCRSCCSRPPSCSTASCGGPCWARWPYWPR